MIDPSTYPLAIEVAVGKAKAVAPWLQPSDLRHIIEAVAPTLLEAARDEILFRPAVRAVHELALEAERQYRRAEHAHTLKDEANQRWLAATSTPVTGTGTARCPSCDHTPRMHEADGCWFTSTQGPEGKDLVCPCTRANGSPASVAAKINVCPVCNATQS